MELSYTDRFFIAGCLEVYIDRLEHSDDDYQILCRLLRDCLKDNQNNTFFFDIREQRLILEAVKYYPRIGLCNGLVLNTIDEIISKFN